ncbi:MAG: hypothetical protein A2Y71_05570 [Bacteroidetes bacterium RBG_13_42_15]|nr:MAG: hypothetical protein A2Y71_05570 [Bacteroidetes bacterium RBG_13_42_15]
MPSAAELPFYKFYTFPEPVIVDGDYVNTWRQFACIDLSQVLTVSFQFQYSAGSITKQDIVILIVAQCNTELIIYYCRPYKDPWFT